jgi:hypothetical protein
MTSTRRSASAGARATRSRAITELTAITASASASRPAFQRRLASMYGIAGSAAGHAGPAWARMQRVIMPPEQAGHSIALDRSWIRSDQ